MESLAALLIVPDIKTKIASLKQYIKSANKYADKASSFLPMIKDKDFLPLLKSKYSGKVAYVNWITRGKTMYLNLNVCYNARGDISCFEVLTKQATIKKVFDVNRIRTLDGKRFKKYNALKRREAIVYSVDTKRLYPDHPVKLLENGLENFASRDKILKKFEMLET
jgi:hypothetical protein